MSTLFSPARPSCQRRYAVSCDWRSERAVICGTMAVGFGRARDGSEFHVAKPQIGINTKGAGKTPQHIHLLPEQRPHV